MLPPPQQELPAVVLLGSIIVHSHDQQHSNDVKLGMKQLQPMLKDERLPV
jgi:hypothetical protein